MGEVIPGEVVEVRDHGIEFLETPDSYYDDPELRYLSYYTDNGAMYYYNTENHTRFPKYFPPSFKGATGMRKTMDDVLAWLKSDAGLPVGALQLDSWWYVKDREAGLVLWEPAPQVFPSGWAPLGGLPLVLHNRWFALDSEYVRRGNYSWVIDPGATASNKDVAVPVDPKLFKHHGQGKTKVAARDV